MKGIVIGADLVPTQSNIELFKTENIDELLGKELRNILDAAEYRIFNLEVPLTNNVEPIDKCGPNLQAQTEAINGYKAMGVNILTLANNHIFDQGEQGLKSTCEILDNNEIAYLGAGNNLEEARKPYIFEYNNKHIGIYACAEHEFSIATHRTAGANPFEPLDSLEHVAELKRQCEYVIVLYHGGKEHYRYPSPDLQKRCRKLVEKGAELVICQHSHCIGCEEKYLNGTIVYGQGNFLFDRSESEYWRTSLLIHINDNFELTYYPIVKCENKVRLAEGKIKEDIIKEFKNRSEEIKQIGFVEKEYMKLAEKMLDYYLLRFRGNRSFLLRALNKLSGERINKFFLKHKYDKKSLIALQNFMECEAHRELVLMGIKERFR